MRRSSIAASVIAFAVLVTSRSQAQSDAVARAQALFEQAVVESRAADYASACPKFAASQALDPKTSTLLNLGSCYELQGRIASSWAAFKEAAVLARKHGRADWAERASVGVARLEPKLVRLTVHVPDPMRDLQLRVDLDGTSLDRAEWELAMPVDPGTHRIDWSAPGFKARSEAVTVASSNLTFTLHDLEPLPEPSASLAPSAPAASVAAPRAFWTTGRVVGVSAGAVGAGAMIAGTIFALAADAKYEEAVELCGGADGTPRVCAPAKGDRAIDAREAAGTRADVATALFIAGGALAAGGVALFVLTPPSGTRRVAITPWHGGAALVGCW